MSIDPILAARSSMILPDALVKKPRCCDMPRSVTSHLGGDFCALLAEIAALRRLERRDRELRRIEPARAPDLGFRLLAREVDASEIDLEVGARTGQVVGLPVDARLPFAEPAFDVRAH